MTTTTPDEDIERARVAFASTAMLQYPEILPDHHMIFNLKNYRYQNQIINSERSVAAEPETEVGIALPIPTNLVDNYNVNINSQEIGQLGNAAREAAAAAMRAESVDLSQIKEFARALGVAANAINKNDIESLVKEMVSSTTISGRALRSVVDRFSPGIGSGIDTASGTAFNPHTVLAFDGMNLKSHSFSWTFAPKSRAETESIYMILKEFKKAALPKFPNISSDKTGGAANLERFVLEYPKMVDIEFQGSVMDIEYLYKFKTCMINEISINYAPSGQPSFVTDRVKDYPAFIQMDINLTETQIRTREDEDGTMGE